MLLDAREHHPHSVSTVLQERDLHAVHVVGQLLDVRLQFGERWGTERTRG